MGADDNDRRSGATPGDDEAGGPADGTMGMPGAPDAGSAATAANTAATPTDSRSAGSRSRRRPAPGPSAGADFERRVARVEFAEGALARLRVPVFVDAEAGRDQLTDLDVLALEFDNRLRLSR